MQTMMVEFDMGQGTDSFQPQSFPLFRKERRPSKQHITHPSSHRKRRPSDEQTLCFSLGLALEIILPRRLLDSIAQGD